MKLSTLTVVWTCPVGRQQLRGERETTGSVPAVAAVWCKDRRKDSVQYAAVDMGVFRRENGLAGEVVLGRAARGRVIALGNEVVVVDMENPDSCSLDNSACASHHGHNQAYAS